MYSYLDNFLLLDIFRNSEQPKHLIRFKCFNLNDYWTVQCPEIAHSLLRICAFYKHLCASEEYDLQNKRTPVCKYDKLMEFNKYPSKYISCVSQECFYTVYMAVLLLVHIVS